MNKKVSLGAALSFAAIIAAVTFIITMYFSINIFNQKVTDVNQREELYKKIAEVDSLVRKNYSGTIDENVLLDSISKGYVSGLNDKYAQYYTAEELKRLNSQNEGVTVGIGVSIVQDESGYIKIVEVYKNSPAEAAGFKENDLIVKVGDKDVVATGYTESYNLIQGAAGTKVKLTIRRNGVDQKPTELIRKSVDIPSVEYRMIDTNGYVKITDFAENTIDQFTQAVDSCQKQGAQALIFDLRNNTGGTLDSVLSILDYLLPEGELASATYSDGTTESLKTSDDSYIDLPMVILTNSSTASAAELFAAAVKDFQKGVTVGTNTYGKGVMQTTYSLSDGSGVRITTAKFNPPSRVNFDGVGIAPDYEVALTAEQETKFESLNETNDPQLIKAIEVANAAAK